DCLSSYILDYFNDKHTEPCGTCSNCINRKDKVDITEQTQMILSCIKRMGESFGVTLTAKVLRGSNDQRIRSFNFHKLSTYGLLSKYTERDITEWINFLIAEGIVSTKESRYPTLHLNKKSLEVLTGKRNVLDLTFGVTLTAKVLRGSNDQRIRSFNFHKLSTYGLLSKYTERDITEWINFLIAEGIVSTKESRYPTLHLNKKSLEVLTGKRNV